MKAILILVRTLFKIGSVIAPKFTAKRGFRVFQKVRIKSIRKRENEFYEKAKKFTVLGKYETIDCFEFGDPSGELIILVHGWESNAGSMSKLAFRFADLGRRVVAFNLPGH
ncbi:MAG: alpha/beta fold hydrolase, partial [Crocinitomicaceae bacterium]